MSKESVSHIIQDLGYSKVCAEMGYSEPHSQMQNWEKSNSSELLACFEAEGEAFLSQTVTADDTWVHHFAWETKE